MSLNISRRTLLSAALCGMSFNILGPRESLASDCLKEIPFSPDIAVTIASAFAAGQENLPILTTGDPIPLFDVDNSFKGYCLAYFDGGMPHGYVVLNVDCNGLILEYSFAEGCVDPHTEVLLSARQRGRAFAVNDERLFIFGQCRYGVMDAQKNLIATIAEEYPLSQERSTLYRSSRSDTWESVLISYADAYSDKYVMGSSKYCGDLYPITKSQSESAVGLYACGPHALFVISCTLPNSSNTDTIIPYPWNDFSYYQQLWDYTNTQVSSQKDGIKYGETYPSDLASGYVDFCRSRGTSMKADNVREPGFLTYVSHVNKKLLSVFGGGIVTPNGDSGHFMAVNGYSYLHRVSDNKNLQVLSVYDGWSKKRFLNFDFPRYTWKTATLLTHG